MEMNRQTVETLLRAVAHPTTGRDIISMGLVENIQVEGRKIRMRLVFPQPDPQASAIKRAIEQRLADAFPEG